MGFCRDRVINSIEDAAKKEKHGGSIQKYCAHFLLTANLSPRRVANAKPKKRCQGYSIEYRSLSVESQTAYIRTANIGHRSKPKFDRFGITHFAASSI